MAGMEGGDDNDTQQAGDVTLYDISDDDAVSTIFTGDRPYGRFGAQVLVSNMHASYMFFYANPSLHIIVVYLYSSSPI